MARPTWKGYLGFGLVQLPVQLHPATQEDDIDFTMLDRRNMSPIGYQRINKKTKKEVPWDDIVRGVQVSRGKYVIIGPNDLKAAHPKATRSIDITDFVDASEISPMRWSSSYFIAPDPKAAPKAYVVLREALRRTGKVGVAKVVIRSRQHLCAITVEGDALVLAMLRFDDELRNAEDLEELAAVAETKATKKELDLAEQLISTMSGPWESKQYRDEYQDALADYIDKKVKSGELDEAPEIEDEETEAPQGKVVDLMAALQASLKKGTKTEKAERPKRRAATARRSKTPRRASPKKRASKTARKAA
jgi:DNA end-binding protein Ku